MPRLRKYASDADRQAAYRQRRNQRQLATALSGNGTLLAAELADLPRTGHSNRANYRRRHRLVLIAVDDLRAVGREMQEYFDRRSENWQEGERGEEFSDLRETQEQAQELLEDLSQALTLRCPSLSKTVATKTQRNTGGVTPIL